MAQSFDSTLKREYLANFREQESYRSYNSGSNGSKSSQGERKPAARPKDSERLSQAEIAFLYAAWKKKIERQNSNVGIDDKTRVATSCQIEEERTHYGMRSKRVESHLQISKDRKCLAMPHTGHRLAIENTVFFFSDKNIFVQLELWL